MMDHDFLRTRAPETLEKTVHQPRYRVPIIGAEQRRS